MSFGELHSQNKSLQMLKYLQWKTVKDWEGVEWGSITCTCLSLTLRQLLLATSKTELPLSTLDLNWYSFSSEPFAVVVNKKLSRLDPSSGAILRFVAGELPLLHTSSLSLLPSSKKHKKTALHLCAGLSGLLFWCFPNWHPLQGLDRCMAPGPQNSTADCKEASGCLRFEKFWSALGRLQNRCTYGLAFFSFSWLDHTS